MDNDFDRVPPSDIEAEQSVLGAMLLSKDAVGTVTMELQGRDFYSPKHEVIFDTIVDMFGKNEPADMLTVRDRLDRDGQLQKIGDASYLATLANSVPTTANAGYYARIVKDKAKLRRLVQAGTRVVQLGYAQTGGDADDIISTAEAEIYAVTQTESKNDYRQLGELISPMVDVISSLQENKGRPAGVPTGFADLDRVLHGLRPGQMIIIAARPGMGKSTLALDFCRHASIKNGITSVIFSLEMSNEDITMRMLASEGGVSMERMQSGELRDKDWIAIAHAADSAANAPLFIDDSPNMSIPEILSKCRRLKQQHNLGLVVIDYLQLMSSNKRVESRQQEVSEYSRALKLLAKELGVPVIAVSQLNRGPEGRNDKRPMISDLRESGSLEQDADVVMLVHRPSYYDENDRPGEADIIIAKHRNGETRTVPMIFQGHFSRFANLAQIEG